jgi:hypothetical protein
MTPPEFMEIYVPLPEDLRGDWHPLRLLLLGRCARQTRQCQGCAYGYDEALMYPPNWKRLKFARESLTKRAG